MSNFNEPYLYGISVNVSESVTPMNLNVSVSGYAPGYPYLKVQLGMDRSLELWSRILVQLLLRYYCQYTLSPCLLSPFQSTASKNHISRLPPKITSVSGEGQLSAQARIAPCAWRTDAPPQMPGQLEGSVAQSGAAAADARPQISAPAPKLVLGASASSVVEVSG